MFDLVLNSQKITDVNINDKTKNDVFDDNDDEKNSVQN